MLSNKDLQAIRFIVKEELEPVKKDFQYVKNTFRTVIDSTNDNYVDHE